MKKIFFILILTIIFINCCLSYINWFDMGYFKIFFFDVGQGDSILIITPGGKTILIDGGPDDKILRGLGEALPFWNRQIDLLVVTHAHDDHIAGLISVSRRYLIKQVIFNNLSFKNPTLEALTKNFKERRIKSVSAREGLSFSFANNCSLKVLAASNDFVFDENDYSMVTIFNCLNKNVLLTGDAGLAIENYLLNKKINLKSDILKISHHGSNSASSENFLKATNPGAVVISVGKDNKFKHPNLTILERLKKMSVDIYRTDKAGTIGFLANINKIKLIK